MTEKSIHRKLSLTTVSEPFRVRPPWDHSTVCTNLWSSHAHLNRKLQKSPTAVFRSPALIALKRKSRKITVGCQNSVATKKLNQPFDLVCVVCSQLFSLWSNDRTVCYFIDDEGAEIKLLIEPSLLRLFLVLEQTHVLSRVLCKLQSDDILIVDVKSESVELQHKRGVCGFIARH